MCVTDFYRNHGITVASYMGSSISVVEYMSLYGKCLNQGPLYRSSF